MIQSLIDLINSVVPESYEVSYEESHMMNIKADKLKRDRGFVYIEEYRSGTYNNEKYGQSKTTRLQIYFGKFTPMHGEALARETKRNEIEHEAVLPFLRAWRASNPRNDEQGAVQFAAALPRFDANEVSICLTLNITEEICD